MKTYLGIFDLIIDVVLFTGCILLVKMEITAGVLTMLIAVFLITVFLNLKMNLK